jgi:putative transposase
MLNEKQLEEIMERHQLSAGAKDKVRRIRKDRPSRLVNSGPRNVASRYASIKMRCIIQAESQRGELAALYLWDHDKVTHEFYDQPGKVPFRYRNAANRNCAHNSTPDYFIIQEDFIGWVECKTESDLVAKQNQGSPLYVRDADGKWRCPPGEDYAHEYGLGFKVRSSSENPDVYLRNLKYLSDYWGEGRGRPDEREIRAVLAVFDNKPWIRLDELKNAVDPNLINAVHKMIVDGDIYVNLQTDLMCEPRSAKVFRNEAIAQIHMAFHYEVTNPLDGNQPVWSAPLCLTEGQMIEWDGRLLQVNTVGESAAYLIDKSEKTSRLIELPHEHLRTLLSEGAIKSVTSSFELVKTKAEEIIFKAGTVDQELALHRLECLRQADAGEADILTKVKPRTLRYWKQLRNKGRAVYGEGLVGLISNIVSRGNRQRKIDADVIKVMDQVIEQHYLGTEAKSISICYGIVRVECQSKALDAPSEKTFRAQIKKFSSAYEMKLAREGTRAAYKDEEFYFELDRSTPRHGDRCFEIGHIDHTEVDLQMVGTEHGELLKRPWLTMLICAYSRMVLAYVLSFDPPSYRSCMLVLRECVKRHGRLPSTIVVDKGKEFGSTYFETLLAHTSTTKKTRPSAKPRFGSVMERIFGVANVQCIHQLVGNNKALQKARQMSPSHDPRTAAVWTLPDFYEKFDEYVYETYANLEHPALGLSPQDAFNRSLVQSGLRSSRFIPNNNEFKLLCLPGTKKGTVKIFPEKGVKVGYFYYFHDFFRNPKYAKQEVPIKYDPFDVSIVYVYLERQWIRCTSMYEGILKGKTEKEIQVVSGELRSRSKLSGQRRMINAETLAKFILEGVQTEAVLLQRKKDAQFRQAQEQREKKAAPINKAEKQQDVPSDEVASDWSELDIQTYGEFK